METAWDLLAPPCTDQMSLLITRYVVAGSSFLIKGPEKIVRSDITPSFCFCSCCAFRLASQETLILEERKSITTENAAMLAYSFTCYQGDFIHRDTMAQPEWCCH